MRVVYAGTPEFAVPALDALVAAGHELVAVYTQPDRTAGRGRELRASPVKARATQLGLAVEQPVTLRDEAADRMLASYAPDVMVVAAYGLLLPPAVLGVPRLGCVNIHASLLPRWRGAAPVQRAIEAGDSDTGVSIMQMEHGLDTGPVYASRSTPISGADTGATLTARLAELGAALLIDVLPALAQGASRATPQPESGVTYAAKLDKREARIEWRDPATVLARRVRAFDPWPVAETTLAGATLRVWDAQPIDTVTSAPPASVVALGAAGIDVATGAGLLRLTRVQAAGRKPVTAREFLNAAGASLAVGSAFGS